MSSLTEGSYVEIHMVRSGGSMHSRLVRIESGFETATNSPANGTDTVFTFAREPVGVLSNNDDVTSEGTIEGKTFTFGVAPSAGAVIWAACYFDSPWG